MQVLCTAPAAAAGPHGCGRGLHARVGLCTALINPFHQAVGVRKGFQPCQQGAKKPVHTKHSPGSGWLAAVPPSASGTKAGLALHAPSAPLSPDQGPATLPSEGRRCGGSSVPSCPRGGCKVHGSACLAAAHLHPGQSGTGQLPVRGHHVLGA